MKKKTKRILESKLQRDFLKELRRIGKHKCIPRSINQTALDLKAMPDVEILTCRDGGPYTIFVELKRYTGKLEELQQHRIMELRALGYDVRKIDTHEQGMEIVKEIRGNDGDNNKIL